MFGLQSSEELTARQLPRCLYFIYTSKVFFTLFCKIRVRKHTYMQCAHSHVHPVHLLGSVSGMSEISK